MSDPVLGNKAEELGQFDKGGDFYGVNRSEVPEGDRLNVAVEEIHGETVITPAGQPQARESSGIALATTEDHRLMSLLVEEPEQVDFVHPVVGKVTTSGSRMARIQARNRNREELVWYGIRSNLQMAALDLPLNANARIVVRQDSTESEYSCTTCKGKGFHLDEPCGHCDGRPIDDAGVHCPTCIVLGFGREQKYSSGHLKCASCYGTGWRGGIVIPEVAQTMPVSGIIVSLGPNTQVCKLGDRVLHSKYAGHSLTTPEKETFTIMRESEILGLVRDR